MTTQATPLLGLALPVTGELSGTWGTTVNDSLTSLVDSAIAGIVTVNVVSANQALTHTALIANEARSAILKLTTSTVSAFSVYAPPRSKLYVVWNASSYLATLYNSTVAGNTTAAGTGILIPSGARVLVMTDGTNFTGTGVTQSSASVASSATITPSIGAPQYNVTALAEATSFAAPAAGADGQRLVLRILDDGTSRNLTWTTTSGGYRVIGTALPSATIANKVLYVALIYNSQASFWDVVAVALQS